MTKAKSKISRRALLLAATILTLPPVRAQALAPLQQLLCYNAKNFGAVGDGVTDDTAALQAAINASIAAEINCYVPRGTYKITGTLIVGADFTGSNNIAGWSLFGDGPKPDSASGPGGTIFRQFGGSVGSPLTAVMQVGSALHLRCKLRDFGLECVTPGAATYGLLFDSTEFSDHRVDRVDVSGASAAYAILAGTGANGENIRFSDCYAQKCDKFFYTNAGQAYVQSFDHCGCFLNANGTYFHLDHTNGGGGIDVHDFNGTAAKVAGTNLSNSTLFWDNVNTSIANFFGGRIEFLTCVYRNTIGSSVVKTSVQIVGMQFTVDSNQSDSHLTLPYFIDSNGPWGGTVTLQGVILYAVSPATVTIQLRTNNSSQPGAKFIFKACIFQNLISDPQLLATATNAPASAGVIRFDDCSTN